MKKASLLKAAVLVLIFIIPVVSEAITVHLKDGEEIQALSAWQAGNTVYVLRNRDILLEFDKNEVDLSKTRIRKGEAPVSRKRTSPPPQAKKDETPAETKTSSEAAPASMQTLFDAYKSACEANDMDAMMALVYWEGADEKTKKGIQMALSFSIGSKIESIVKEELAQDEKLSYTTGGVTYMPNLKPAGRMKVTYLPEEGKQMTMKNSSSLIGEKDGKWYIVAAAPAENEGK